MTRFHVICTLSALCLTITVREFPAQKVFGPAYGRHASNGSADDINRADGPGGSTRSPQQRRGICYATPDGDDSNDGLTWDSAKYSLMACYDDMGGDGGTIYFTDGNLTGDSRLVHACKLTDPPGCGIWIMGHKDPNFVHPLPGWRIAKKAGVNFVGVGGANFGANSHDGPKVGVVAGGNRRDLPSIWLSSVVNVSFANMNLHASARPIVVGEDSRGSRTGSGACSSITFTNVDPNIFNATGNGPGFDITGNSFWVWIKNSLASGFYANPLTADNRAAILLDGTGGFGVGMIFVSDTNVNGGGVKYVPGTNPGSLVVRNLTIEGDFTHDIPPAVWISGTGTANGTTLLADNVFVADAGPLGAAAVRIDGGLADNSTVIGAVGAGTGGRNVQGPAVIVSQFQSPNLGPSNDNVSPLRQGQNGFIFGHVVGQHDSARRAFGPAVTRFQNIAPQQSTSWKATQFGGTTAFARGIRAPDGTSNAAGASNKGSKLKQMLSFVDADQRIAVDDWFIGGAWVRSQTANGYAQSNTQGLTFGIVAEGDSATGRQSSAINKGDGEWEWQWLAERITASAKTPARIIFAATFDDAHAIEAYAPILIHVPAGTLSENEVYELAVNLQTYPDTTAVGDVSTLRNQRLSVGGTTSYFAKLTHACSADCIQYFPDSPGPNYLTASNLAQNWAKPQIFSAGSKFGSGNMLSRYARLSAVISPAPVKPNTCGAQSFTIRGATAGDILIAVSKPTEQAGLSVSPGHVIGVDAATANFCNNTGSVITPTSSETYQFIVVQ